MSTDYAVFCGLDVGEGGHHAVALVPRGTRGPRPGAAAGRGPAAGPVHRPGRPRAGVGGVDQPATIGPLPVAVALDAGCEVAYFPGLTMRRIADLHPGAAKTDARDAYVIADAARTLPHTLRRVDTGDEALADLQSASHATG